jgi:hypothetical protein
MGQQKTNEKVVLYSESLALKFKTNISPLLFGIDRVTVIGCLVLRTEGVIGG